MNKLKTIITTHPALALSKRGNDDFIFRTNTSDYSLGGTLRQMQAGEEKVFAYFSRKLRGADTRYATYDKELLAIRDCLKHWRHYLLRGGRKVQVTTDHSCIQHKLTQTRLTPRKMRALQYIMEYDVDVKYMPGAKNYVQDALSRRPDYQKPPLPRDTVSRRERETRKKAQIARAGDVAGTEVPGKVSGKASGEVRVRGYGRGCGRGFGGGFGGGCRSEPRLRDSGSDRRRTFRPRRPGRKGMASTGTRGVCAGYLFSGGIDCTERSTERAGRRRGAMISETGAAEHHKQVGPGTSVRSRGQWVYHSPKLGHAVYP
jgi:hypothetical protein